MTGALEVDLATVRTARLHSRAGFLYVQQREVAPEADLATVRTARPHSRADFLYVQQAGKGRENDGRAQKKDDHRAGVTFHLYVRYKTRR